MASTQATGCATSDPTMRISGQNNFLAGTPFPGKRAVVRYPAGFGPRFSFRFDDVSRHGAKQLAGDQLKEERRGGA